MWGHGDTIFEAFATVSRLSCPSSMSLLGVVFQRCGPIGNRSNPRLEMDLGEFPGNRSKAFYSGIRRGFLRPWRAGPGGTHKHRCWRSLRPSDPLTPPPEIPSWGSHLLARGPAPGIFPRLATHCHCLESPVHMPQPPIEHLGWQDSDPRRLNSPCKNLNFRRRQRAQGAPVNPSI